MYRNNLASVFQSILLLAGTVFCLCVPVSLLAQTREQLEQIIFDPEPLAVTPDHEAGPGRLPDSDVRGVSGESDTIADPRVILANIDRYRTQLDRTEDDDGPFSVELFQILLNLGIQYQQLDEHETAIEYFVRAEQIARIANGLFHPQQVASIEKLIESYRALGDVENVDRQRQYLVYVNQQYYGTDSVNTIPSLVSVANSKEAEFVTIITSPRKPFVELGVPLDPLGGGFNVGWPKVNAIPPPFDRIVQAQEMYFRAVSIMWDNRSAFDPQMLVLERRLRQAVYEEAYLGGQKARCDCYMMGMYSLERVLFYLSLYPDEQKRYLADVLIEYGDWDILFHNNNDAMDRYRQAYALMSEAQAREQELNQVFRPGEPVHLPLSGSRQNSRERFGIDRDAQLEYEGHIDIAFTISKRGKAGNFDILDREGKVTGGVRRQLRRFLTGTPFRPQFDDNADPVNARVAMRYYFTAPGDW